ncbi:phage protease [Tabrizicola sp.]|uniref:phage protease n=1 Tax=Tabrizicola sp. TaxID=2005166 RepID=UPI0025EEB09E|nr:phage protease [Tabrizicola sp.]
MQHAPAFAPRFDLIALAASAALPALGSDGSVPEWVQLLPVTQGEVQTYDGRGPYLVKDLTAIIQASMAWERGIPIDENHATDLRPGHEAPARGWIVELQARDNGLWGRVEWTAAGRALVADKAYRGISPVLMVSQADKRTVTLIPRASLVNVPNLCGLAALNTEETSRMEGMSKIAEKLGLPADASLDQILAKIGSMADKKDDASKSGPDAALQSALTEIGTTVGLPSGTPDAIVAAVKVKTAGGGDAVALQSQLTALQSELTTMRTAQTRSASEAYVDGEVKKGRTGINATNRETLITLHMSQPDQAKTIIEAQPIVAPTTVVPGGKPPVDKDGNVDLNAEQLEAAKVLGIPQADFLKTLKEEAR